MCTYASLDTTIIKDFEDGNSCSPYCLDDYLADKRLKIAMDNIRSLEDEWRETCSSEFVDQIVIHWNDLNGFHFSTPKTLPDDVRKDINKNNGINGTIDKLQLRLMHSVSNKNKRVIVSRDKHFWDPRDTDETGNRKARNANDLDKALGINIYLLHHLLRHLG